MEQKHISLESVRRELERNPFGKLSGIVLRILEDAILTGELKPGERLNVAKLAGEMDVSATPVREAVDQLCTKGLVRAEQKSDGKYLNYYVLDITNTSITNLFVARKSVEGMAAYICAERNWDVNLDELGRLAHEFQSKLRDYSSGVIKTANLFESANLDMSFHRLLVKSSRNEYLVTMYDAIARTVEYLSIRTNQFLSVKRDLERNLMIGGHHVAIYNAVKLGFPESARTVMENHIDYCAKACLANRHLTEK